MRSRFRAVFAATLFSVLVVVAPAHAAFPGANGKIAFGLFQNGNSDIWVMNPDGTNRVNLTNTPSVDEDSPAWSADGTQIAYRRITIIRVDPARSEAATAIWAMNADGSGQREVVPPPPARQCTTFPPPCTRLGDPAWSPDGTKLVFDQYDAHSDPNGRDYDSYDLNTVNADGTGRVLLARAGGLGPRWSPDGTKIGYSLYDGQDGGLINIWWITPDGSRNNYVYDSGFSFDRFSDWSPDGSLMAGCGPGPSRDGCYTVRPDGTGKTDLPSNVRVFESVLAWSPDGNKFVWGTTDIYTGNIDGTGVTNLGPGRDPDWQPIPNRPPDCSSVLADPDTLRPANKKLVPVSLAGVTDPDGDAVSLSITGVTQDEPTGRKPDATLGPTGDRLSLRANRSNHGDGRVYRIAFTESDSKGGSCSGTATVSVPRKSKKPAVDSAPPSYDSFAR